MDPGDFSIVRLYNCSNYRSAQDQLIVIFSYGSRGR